MTTDSGTPLSEFLATSWTWAEQTQKHPISARNGGPLRLSVSVVCAVNRPGMSGDSSSWKGWGHVRWFIEEVPAGAA
ncbi:hypothetical protein DSI16_18660 [Mycobacterium tuberculosis]|nr:hypothetical protein DSI16_18660 [Mycobacterium tuberculosis]REM47453.1 hypothetical protein DSI47_14715 [Mycobacterium tuberculosis]REX52041.1 hypothetical protein DSL02_14875 [Mycobacterium tuberculosis]